MTRELRSFKYGHQKLGTCSSVCSDIGNLHHVWLGIVLGGCVLDWRAGPADALVRWWLAVASCPGWGQQVLSSRSLPYEGGSALLNPHPLHTYTPYSDPIRTKAKFEHQCFSPCWGITLMLLAGFTRFSPKGGSGLQGGFYAAGFSSLPQTCFLSSRPCLPHCIEKHIKN